MKEDWSGGAPLRPSVRFGTGFVNVSVVTICAADNSPSLLPKLLLSAVRLLACRRFTV